MGEGSEEREDDLSVWQEFYARCLMFSDPESASAIQRAERMRPLLKELLDPPGRTLDLACGAGVYSFLLEELGHEVVGLDALILMIERAREVARKRKSSVKFELGDARKLPYPDDSFDYVVFLGNSLPHFSIEDAWSMLGEVARVLKPGGKFLAEYSDFIQLMATGQYKDHRLEPERVGVVISYHAGYRGDEGYITRLFHYVDTGKTEYLNFHLWAPWIFRFLAKQRNFVLTRTRLFRERCYLDLFKLE